MEEIEEIEEEFNYEIEDEEVCQVKENRFDYEIKKRYSNMCERMGVSQISCFIENISNENLNMAYRGIGSKSIKPITFSLRNNTKILNIDLTDNNLENPGTILIASVFNDNLFIKHLNLSCNRIGSEGLVKLLEVLRSNQSLEYLNLSDNSFTDRVGDALKRFLTSNKFLIELNFSKNNLCTQSGIQLREGLENNSTLEKLDLSWNQIRCQGAVELAHGLAKNNGLKVVNLAWNGFSDKGAEAIGKALMVNDYIEELDLSYNRITDIGVKGLTEGLSLNRAIRKLRLGWNPIQPEGVNSILKSFIENDCTRLEGLYFETILVNEGDKKNMDTLTDRIPDLIIKIGGYTTGGLDKYDENALRKELLNILKAYLVKNRLRMVDLFNQWDKDKSFTITRQEFRNGVRTCKIPLSESQLDILIEWLDNDGSDSIDYPEFLGITDIE